MSERILKALMQLFAIIAKVDGVTNDGRTIVQTFLKQQLSSDLVDQYLKLFDEFMEAHHQVSKKKDGSAKRTSLNSVKVLKICTQINSELTQRQKVVVLARLIEFIHSSYEISEQELEFVQTVAETFNIEPEEFKRMMAFVQNSEESIPDSNEFLIINSKPEHPFEKTRHIYNESVSGQIRVLAIDSVTIYLLQYIGDAELYLNGQIIAPDKLYILNPGSSIRSSKVQPIYYSDIISSFLADRSKKKVTFTAKNLEYKFKGGKLGLRGINMSEESGKLIGIMGGSGAGKSTLLTVLNGNETPSGGEVLINGINIHTQKSKIEGVIGHVSQDDLLIEELTVFQNLFYNGKLCFGNMGDAELTKRVDSVLTDIGLFEAKDLKVGSPLEKTISGGQRKRLNISLELIREPLVMFVDEPTSGLSSRDSENIMDLLKELSLKGKLIFVVIHQPSSDIFKMFDKLMILDVGGYPIYYGNPVDAVIYFKTRVNHVNCNESECPACGNVNPEQIFNIIESKVVDEYGELTRIRKVSPGEWNNMYRDHIEVKTEFLNPSTEIPESTFNIPNRLKQFKVFITRDVLAKLTDKQYLSINLLEAPVLAFILSYLIRFYSTDASNLLGYTYRDNENIPVYLFMSVVVSLFLGLTVAAEEIIKDRKIQKRERFLNLSRSSYLVSKISIMFVLSAIQSITFLLVGNSILGIKGMWTDYWFVLFTTSCFANMLGLNISSAFNNAVTIYILIPFLIIPQLLLSGVIVKFNKLNPTLTSQSIVPFSGEIMTSRWAFEALAVDQFKDNLYERNFYEYERAQSTATYKKDYWLPELRPRVDEAETMQKNGDKKGLERDLSLLRLEVGKEVKRNPNVKFDQLGSLTQDKFNSDIAAALREYMNKLSTYYVRRYNQEDDKRNNIITRMNDTGKDTAARTKFLKLKNDYYNESLADLVLNKTDLSKKILEVDGELIQRLDPIFMMPNNNLGRAHFFAPRKVFLGRAIDTYWYNIYVIWSMSLVLALTLYFDLFKKFLNMFELIGEFIASRKKKD
ncbi:MAG: ATP-binding cassette domain-containing protein [Bacteroidia bacterium]